MFRHELGPGCVVDTKMRTMSFKPGLLVKLLEMIFAPGPALDRAASSPRCLRMFSPILVIPASLNSLYNSCSYINSLLLS